MGELPVSEMNQSNKLLSDITVFRTYAKFLPHANRREAWEESVNRLMNMHLDKFPKLSADIVKAFALVHEKQVLPSMRSLQFGGSAILKNPLRSYNCSFLCIDSVRSFGESLFLLLSGCGVGFSVQNRHISQLPKIQQPREEGAFIIHDSIEGWSQAVDMLTDAYFYGGIRPVFDYSGIRAKGTPLITTGSKAPGPDPLRAMLVLVEKMLKAARGRKLKSIEVHDILCLISDCVLAGGVRRSSLISLFDRDDTDMLKCKSGNWWEKYPWRARANNSAVMPLHLVKEDEFFEIYKILRESGSGEPGFWWTTKEGYELDYGANPCVTGDTEILTDTGYHRIDSLLNQKVMAWNGFEFSEIVPVITGYNKPTVEVELSSGQSIRCTQNHKFWISRGYKDFVGSRIEAKDLIPGMKLMKHEYPIITGGKSCDWAYAQGFLSADGMDDYDFTFLYEPKYCCENRLSTWGSIGKESLSYGRKNIYWDTEKFPRLPKNEVPFKWNLKARLDWFAGLLDGDGTELKEGGAQVGSIDKSFLLNTQKLLTTMGVSSKVTPGMSAGPRMMPDGKGGSRLFDCKESWRLLIGSKQIQLLKSLGMDCCRLKFDKAPQRDASQFVQVVSVKKADIASVVYCFTEPKRNLGCFNGVVTGQCNEIGLISKQLCNLTTINTTGIDGKREFLRRARAAAFIGTLQASYTDFHFVRPAWQENSEADSLLGVSMTGIADSGDFLNAELLQEAAKLVMDTNETYAKKIGINMASRCTALKPEGTSSTVLGSSSGMHDRWSQHYIRRVRMSKDDSLAKYLKIEIPDLVEDDLSGPNTVVVSIPQESPEGAHLRSNSSALDLFERNLMLQKNWVRAGHRKGANYNNVSCTITVRDEEWDDLGKQLWKHRNSYTGISLIPSDMGSYKQAPFEEITKEAYDQMSAVVKAIDLRRVYEADDYTSRAETVACSGGVCEI